MITPGAEADFRLREASFRDCLHDGQQIGFQKREYHLRPMPKYREKYGSALDYLNLVAARMKERFSPEEIEQFDQMLHTVVTELMPEMHSLNTNRVAREE